MYEIAKNPMKHDHAVSQRRKYQYLCPVNSHLNSTLIKIFVSYNISPSINKYYGHSAGSAGGGVINRISVVSLLTDKQSVEPQPRITIPSEPLIYDTSLV